MAMANDEDTELCETCASGRWEHGYLTGEPSFVHADGRREFYYECGLCSSTLEKATPRYTNPGVRDTMAPKWEPIGEYDNKERIKK